jgi:hypothetical protein
MSRTFHLEDCKFILLQRILFENLHLALDTCPASFCKILQSPTLGCSIFSTIVICITILLLLFNRHSAGFKATALFLSPMP